MEEVKKKMKGKVVFKHETEADWLKSNYIPDEGEMVLYDEDDNYDYKRMKYGNGKDPVNDLPFSIPTILLEKGEGENSIQQSNTGAKAISENAIAEQGCFAGLKGFIFNDSNSENPSEFNGDGSFIIRATNSNDNPVEDFYNNYKDKINNKAKISFINGSKYTNYATVIMSYTAPLLTITSVAINNDAKGNVTWNYKNYTGCDSNGLREQRPADGTALDECTFFFLDYPDAGYVDLGTNSRSTGRNAKALAIGAFSAGRDTIAQCQYATTFGRGTKANYACMAINRDSQALGDNSFAGGNKSLAKNLTSMAWGNNVHTSANYQVVLGKFNKDETTAEFIVGVGTSNSAQKNGLVVWNDGRVSSGNLTPINDIDLTPKKWVEDNTASKAWVENTLETVVQPIEDRVSVVENAKVNNNTVVKSSVALGNSTTNASESLTFGYGTKVEMPAGVDKYYGMALGKDCLVSSQYSAAIGYGLKTAEWESSTKQNRYQTILGKYNEVLDGATRHSAKDGALLIVGNGISDTNRSNAFVIWGDGRASVAKDPTEDMDVVTKRYLEANSGGSKLYRHDIEWFSGDDYDYYAKMYATIYTADSEPITEPLPLLNLLTNNGTSIASINGHIYSCPAPSNTQPYNEYEYIYAIAKIDDANYRLYTIALRAESLSDFGVNIIPRTYPVCLEYQEDGYGTVINDIVAEV